MTHRSVLQVRVDPVEKELFSRAAAASGLRLSAWVRSTLRSAVELPSVATPEQVPDASEPGPDATEAEPPAAVTEKTTVSPYKLPEPKTVAPTSFPTELPKPKYEYAPKDCPNWFTHHSGRVCPRCGATEA